MKLTVAGIKYVGDSKTVTEKLLLPRVSAAPYDQKIKPVPFTNLSIWDKRLSVLLYSAGFLSELDVRLDRETERWVLLEPLVYWSYKFGSVITVPVGFDTDFASVPRFPPLVFALVGDSAHEAAVVHDYLYRFHQLTRCQSDAVLYEAMVSTRQPAWRDYLMWIGVRVGGWFAYHRHNNNPYIERDTPQCFI